MDLGKSDWPEVIEVPLGDGVRPLRFRRILVGGERDSFRMGQRGGEANEEPVTRVALEGPFYLAEVPVTQEQFAVWTGSEDYGRWFEENRELIMRTSFIDQAEPHTNSFSGKSDLPAEQVTWWEAVRFGEWLGEEGLLAPMGDRGLVAGLPGEVQWEYACRVGTETEYHSGDGEAALEEAGWYWGNSEGKTQVVGQKRPNRFGLFEMHGNVWEWCRDERSEERYRLKLEEGGDLDQEESEAVRVLRGGSWIVPASDCRSAFRYWVRPGYRGGIYGFRLGLFPGPVQEVWPEAREGGAASAKAPAAKADLNTNFPPRSGGDFLEENEDNDGQEN